MEPHYGGREEGGRCRKDERGGLYCSRCRCRCVGGVEGKNGSAEFGAIRFPGRRPRGDVRGKSQDTGTAIGGLGTGPRGRVMEVQELPVEVRALGAPFALRCVDEGADSFQGGDAESLPAGCGIAVVAVVVVVMGGPCRSRAVARGRLPGGGRCLARGCRESGSRSCEEKGSCIDCGEGRLGCVGGGEVESGARDVVVVGLHRVSPMSYFRTDSLDAGTGIGRSRQGAADCIVNMRAFIA